MRALQLQRVSICSNTLCCCVWSGSISTPNEHMWIAMQLSCACEEEKEEKDEVEEETRRREGQPMYPQGELIMMGGEERARSREGRVAKMLRESSGVEKRKKKQNDVFLAECGVDTTSLSVRMTQFNLQLECEIES